MASNKKYWKNEAELNPNDSIVEALRQNEFVEDIPVDEFLGDKETLSETNTNRRDFLKYVGFSTSAAALAACEGPIVKSIPYVVQPENIVPGVANYYATTIANGFDFASILIKTREGRPIKVENNTDAKVAGCAYGERALADYDFEKADVIVSFGADFIGDWQGGGYDSGYSKGRVPKHGKMSKHIQIESNMSLAGANADVRIPLTPQFQKIALAYIYTKLKGGAASIELDAKYVAKLDAVVADIKKSKSAVVVSGIDDVDVQTVVLAINGKVGAIIIDGVNPMYSLPNAADFKAGLEKVDFSLVFSTNWNETTEVSSHTAASNHYLESWGDVEIKKGNYSLMQPTIRELFDTRQFQGALLNWMGSDKSYYDYIKETWAGAILGGSSWNKALQDGVYVSSVNMVDTDPEIMVSEEDKEEGDVVMASESVTSVSAAVRSLSKATSAGDLELTLYSKVGMGDGQQANNPWLQEFPDPITRVSWDNYIAVSKADAKKLELENWNVANGGLNGSKANVTVNGVTIPNVPVIIQPGQAVGSVGLSFGYGKKVGMKSEMQTGINAFALYQGFNTIQSVSVEKASGEHEFACIQLQKTLMGRGDIIKETTLEIFNTKDHKEWNHVPQVSLNHNEVPATSVDLWDSFDRTIGHHFNMSIDLNACTGCGSCVIACHAENNVPVVGKAEVRKSRDMHWLRIDRYYSSEDTFEGDNDKKNGFEGLSGDKGSLGGFGELEDPSANPQVAFQPVMCQHCNHAPCETVCPVAATSHGRQGQNQMAYNRCVGTRYCANNCPYKVRRFNWFLYNNNDEFDYHMNDDLGKMVINPDVNVRSRGVIEKCSMCIQKTQKTILDAKRDGRVIEDGEFQTACSSACGNGAIVFGDINDKESKVAELKESDRMYHLLEHVGTKPNVFYHVKVRNTNEA